MKKFLLHILTGQDNATFDMVHVLAVLSVLEGLFLAGWAVIAKGQIFDLQAFGVGAGAMFAGLGVAINLKSKSEP